ncbi:MAG: CopG family transcriptional regulator [Anaerolineae bacterium]|nr:CopG family transcriptional regulator [Anaerolineae bacterium]
MAAYRIVKHQERVRTTITLPGDLLQRSQRFIEDGTVPNRTALIEVALEHMLDQLERDEIDRSFAAMANDAASLALHETIETEFAESDWEALALEESQGNP